MFVTYVYIYIYLVPWPAQDEHLRNIISGVSNLPKLVFLGACRSEMCGRAVAEAGVPHVVAVESGNDVSGTTSTLHYPALPVIWFGGPENVVALSACVPRDQCRISMGMNASHIASLTCIRHSNVFRLPSDEAAQAFCIPFYEALITCNYTVQKAFDIAISSIRTPSASTAAVPVPFLLLPEGDLHWYQSVWFVLPTCIYFSLLNLSVCTRRLYLWCRENS